MSAVVALALTGCGDKETGSGGSGGSGGGGGGDLSIEPLKQIDSEGNEVEAPEASEAADPTGDGSATCEGISLGFAGALSGDNAALGKNIRFGMELAIKKHNDANPDCQVEVKDFDTEGTPEKATQVAPTITGDETVIGLLGPAFSGESEAIDGQLDAAGLPALSASATATSLSTNGWQTFFRGLANDAVQGPSVAAYIKKDLNPDGGVFLIQDDSAYGKGLAEEVSNGLGDVVTGTGDVKTKDKEFSAIVTNVKDSGAGAVFYAGYYAEAAPLVQQLRDGGYEGTFISADGVNDPAFVEGAGSSSEGAILSCPCGPAPEEFAGEYEEVNSATPGVYSVEGYDLTTIMLKAIDSGVTDRAGMLQFVKAYEGQGLARNYKWDETGELEATNIWIYEVK